MTTDTPMLMPMLRIRLYSEVPSLRSVGASVENVTVDSGTNRKPSPRPWTMPVRTMSQPLMSRSKCVISHCEIAVSASPTSSCRRTSTRPDRRPTTSIANIVPTPRGASSSPTSTTG